MAKALRPVGSGSRLRSAMVCTAIAVEDRASASPVTPAGATSRPAASHQDDAELGEVQDRFDVPDQPHAGRADGHPRDQVAEDRAQPGAACERHEQHASR